MAVSCNQIEQLLRNSPELLIRHEHALRLTSYPAAELQPHRVAYRVRRRIVPLTDAWTSFQHSNTAVNASRLKRKVWELPGNESALMFESIEDGE